MSAKKLVLIVGGRSAEHTIALRSAESIVNQLDKSKYFLKITYVDRQGKWYAISGEPEKIPVRTLEEYFKEHNSDFKLTNPTEALQGMDIAFPVIHGTYGEDGTIQGILKGADIPFVGSGILGSAVGMDKEMCKILVKEAGIGIADYLTLYAHNKTSYTFEQVKEKLGIPVFVKPSAAGSSVGVHKVATQEEYDHAIQDAFQYDRKVIIEEAVIGQELECAILGNDIPKASVIGEIVPKIDFYSYDAKYLSDDGADLLIPANINDADSERIQKAAIDAFIALGCEGLSRVDFFLTNDGKLIFNEINTFPGFTSISMYPSLWEASGVPYAELLDQLISFGLDRYEKERKLIVDYR